MYCLNTTCLPSHHHNDFMTTGALGHTHASVAMKLLR